MILRSRVGVPTVLMLDANEAGGEDLCLVSRDSHSPLFGLSHPIPTPTLSIYNQPHTTQQQCIQKMLTMMLIYLLAMPLTVFCNTEATERFISGLTPDSWCEGILPLLHQSNIMNSIQNNMIAADELELRALRASGENCMLHSHLQQLLDDSEPDPIQELSDWCKQVPDHENLDEAILLTAEDDSCATYCYAIARQRAKLVDSLHSKIDHLEERKELELMRTERCQSKIVQNDKVLLK